ncbi:MAG: magnesium chelatase subunit D [Hyphomicrobiaceae bacterium]
MTAPEPSALSLVARLLAIDHLGLGGALLNNASFGTVETFLDLLTRLLPDKAPVRQLPSQISDDRLLGGIDIGRSVARGEIIFSPGLLTSLSGGIAVVPFADRLDEAVAARLAAVLDDGIVRIERDGLSQSQQAHLAVIAAVERVDENAHCSARLADRLAFHVDAGSQRGSLEPAVADEEQRIRTARARLKNTTVPDDALEALTAAATQLGIFSMRAPLLALRAARAAAAYAGRSVVADEDVILAARLVLAPRARQIPTAPEETEPPSPPPPDERTQDQAPETEDETAPDLTEILVATVKASLPDGLLETNTQAQRTSPRAGAGAGNRQKAQTHGRRIGSRPGKLRSDARLDLIATIRAAAPWQPLRRGSRAITFAESDFRIVRYEQRVQSVTIFIVDASGSAALHRLAEAKGAVELLLSESYTRRDEVALIAFRHRKAELLLPPTRSLARAKRVLADMVGGGATPLASGLVVARQLVETLKSQGHSAVCVLLTDGQANIGLDGAAGRPVAEEDVLKASRALAATGAAAVVIDTGLRPRPFTANVAKQLRARYLALPNADAATVSQAVLAESGQTSTSRRQRSS